MIRAFKKIGVAAIALSALFPVIANAQTSNPNFWKLTSGPALVPLVSTWTLGSFANKISAGYFNNLYASTTQFSGVGGNLDFGGFQIQDVGSTTAAGFVATTTVGSGYMGQAGSAAYPTYSFTNARSTGMYLSGTASRFSANGTLALEIGSTAVGLQGSELLQITNGTAASPGIQFSDGNGGMYRPAANQIAFSSNGVNTMTLDASQRVGIGTTTPNWLIQGAGTRPFFALSDTSAGADQQHWLAGSQGGNLVIATSSNTYSTSSVPFLTLKQAGRIGIGTTNPGFDVELKQNTTGLAATLGMDSVGGAGSSINFGTTGSYAGDKITFTSSASHAIETWTNNVSRLFIGTSGLVGVASTSPWALLSVNPNALGSGVPELAVGSSTITHLLLDGNGQFTLNSALTDANMILSTTGSSGYLYQKNGATTKSYWGWDSSNFVFLQASSGLGLKLQSNSVTAITIDTSQRVGIGTSTQTSTVHVVSGVGITPFTLASSSPSIVIKQVNPSGHEFGSTTKPTLSSGQVDGTDEYGEVSGCSSACTVTWNTAYSRPPVCVVSPKAGSVANTFSYAITATTLVVTETSLGTFDYVCKGQ